MRNPYLSLSADSDHNTVTMVFSLRQVYEKFTEQHMGLCAVFNDLTKGFDTVNKEALWVIVTKIGKNCHSDQLVLS